MAELRCPMCGKENLPEAETCRFCEARLKPMVVPPFTGDAAPIEDETASPPASTQDIEPTLPDWLRDLRRQEQESGFAPESQEAATGAAPADGLPDWLQSSEMSAQQAPSEETESPDWLARIRQRSDSEKETEFPGEVATGDQPPSAPTPETGGENVLPDWLAGLTAISAAGETPSEGEEVSGEAGPPQTQPDAAALEEPAPGEVEPGWLQRIRQRQETEAEEPQEPTTLEVGEEETQPEAQPATQLPDWLSGLTGATEGAEAGEVAPAVPDWLTQGGSGTTQEVLAPPAVPSAEHELPEWLAQAGAGSETSTDVTGAEPAKEVEMPGWLSKLEVSATEKEPRSGVPALIMDEEAGSLEEVPYLPGTQAPKEAESTELGAMPDWISQVSSEDTSPAASPSEGEAAPDLEMANLPSWLEAMRPVETAAPLTPVGDETYTQVEKGGPLAGLRGVLPAEPDVTKIRKSRAYSLKLQLGEKQQAHKALLEQILALEGQALELPRKPAISPIYIQRLIIAVLLFLAVFVTLWKGQNRLPWPEGIPEEVSGVNFKLGTLPRNLPVLLAVDYAPGFAGEIEASATAVMSVLLERAPFLVIVSTISSGPVQAERFLSNLSKELKVPELNYTNLGYIPGGATGLLGFAERPSQVLPYDLRGESVWNEASLGNIRSVADFALVMVLTENADTARAWIEQVQPSLSKKDIPMIMVVSAQAEPMVIPYYQSSSKQIAGLVAGLAGGAAFEKLTGRPFGVRKIWDAFGVGMIAAVVVILLGGLLFAFTPQPSSRKRTESDGAL